MSVIADSELPSNRGASVIIVGAGVTGLSAGWWLARSGVDVLVIDRGIAGWEASGRNGGSTAHPFSPLFKEEQRLWPEMDSLLGYPTEYRARRLRVALTDLQMAHYMRIIALAERQGAGWEPLDANQLRELVPFVTDRTIGGVLCRYGGHANPQRTVQAYAWAMQDCGGRLLQHTRVTGITARAGRVAGVVTDRGEFNCDVLVLAAGPEIGRLASLVGVDVPVASARVEMIVTEPVPLLKYGGVDGNGLYGRQTLRGNLAYGGGPHEWLADELSEPVRSPQEPTRDSTFVLRSLAQRLAELFPKVAHARVIRSWAGFVENTPDGRPVLCRVSDPGNLVIATLSSVGFGLSPATGHAVMELALRGECSFADLSALNLDRFAALPKDWRKRMGWLPAVQSSEGLA
jgi:sarcosine oxidase, subunit beta